MPFLYDENVGIDHVFLQVMTTAASWRVRSSVVDFVRELGHSVVLKRDSMEKSVHFIREVRRADVMMLMQSFPRD
jgi:hypothetical protein